LSNQTLSLLFSSHFGKIKNGLAQIENNHLSLSLALPFAFLLYQRGENIILSSIFYPHFSTLPNALLPCVWIRNLEPEFGEKPGFKKGIYPVPRLDRILEEISNPLVGF
jgi:hypothetical protein